MPYQPLFVTPGSSARRIPAGRPILMSGNSEHAFQISTSPAYQLE
ncbi:MAG TPA: hypothetical protein VGA21_01870 [Cyclobacteriaceae bacterium]